MNRICSLFGIQYPIIQAGMVWCSGWRLASAVSNAGGLGLIGAGSMHPEVLREHIRKCEAATDKPFGVNVPLMYPEIDTLMRILVEEKVKIVFTSAGNPKTWTKYLKDHDMTVVHVVSSSKFATKCEEAGVDAIVAEGFEAGGHNGREETTTMCLIPAVRKATSLPLLAAGGIGNGQAMLAALALGADGVQIGTRFALTKESSAHENFKKLCLNLKEGDTKLLLKKLSPTRLVKGDFATAVEEAEARGASVEELRELLGKGRAKKGIFEGDLKEGELEIGQVASLFWEELSVEEVMKELIRDFKLSLENGNKPDETTTTTPSEAKTPTYPLNILKKKKGSEDKLAGAKFKLYSSEADANANDAAKAIKVSPVVAGVAGNYVVDPESSTTEFESVASIDEKGYNLHVNGLAAGDYWLVETEAPAGYNKLTAPIKVTIEKSTDAVDANQWTLKDADGKKIDSKIVTIENSTGSLLPSTGGMGTIIFAVIAAILVLGVAVSFIRDKRKNA